MAPLRAAGYVRVSSARQATEGLSLGEQREAIRKRATAEGWTLVDTFEDAGISGAKDDRPGLQALLATLPDLDRVVVGSLDRLGRRAAGMLELFERFEDAGVALVAIRQGIDTSTPYGKAIPKLLAVLAELEVEQLGERVAAAAKARAAAGRHHSQAPYGYRSKGGGLVPDERRVAVVRRIFELAAAGTSQRQIALALSRQGVKPERSGKWSPATIGAMLRNPTYKGALPVGDETVPGGHEAIVSPELWDKVAGLRKAANRNSKGGPGRNPAGRHLLTRGLLVCAACGSSVEPRRDGARETYRCRGRGDYGADYCDLVPIERDKIDGAVLRYFEDVGLDVDAMRAELDDALQRERELRAARLREAEGAEATAKDRLDRVRRAFQDGALEAEDWNAQRKELTAELEVARAELRAAQAADVQLADAETAAPDSEALARLQTIRQAVAGKVTTDIEGLNAVRAALTSMFDRFEIAKRPGGPELPAAEREIAERVREAASAGLRSSGADPFEAEQYVIVPWPKPELVEGLDAELRPQLRRRGLGVPHKDDAVLFR